MLIQVTYVVLYTQCLRYNICSVWFLDIRISTCSSCWSSVLSGVPQGSVLGPLLFNIYVNDMPNCVNSPVLQFADGVKMFWGIGGAADFQQLQANINNFVD